MYTYYTAIIFLFGCASVDRHEGCCVHSSSSLTWTTSHSAPTVHSDMTQEMTQKIINCENTTLHPPFNYEGMVLRWMEWCRPGCVTTGLGLDSASPALSGMLSVLALSDSD